jgi:hypothetical protein
VSFSLKEDFMFKKLAAYSLVAVMFGAGSVAMAHTGVKDAGVEGKTLYTAFTIGHGCGSTANPTQLPVIAQSVVFPNAVDSQAFKIDPVTFAETPIDLTTQISGLVAGAGLTTLAPKGVQDAALFKNMSSTVDSLGVVRGLKLTQAKLDPTMVGLVPFKVSGVKFDTTSCAKSLKVRVAVANWCQNINDPTYDRRADVWIGHMTTKFNDPEVMPEGFATAPYWPTLTINRDLVANPLPSTCGTGYDVAIQPSDADIDANLPVKGFWPMGGKPVPTPITP